MISKVKGIVLVGILSLASIMMPFSVYADSFEWYHVTGELMSSQLNNELTINNTKVYEYLFNYQYHVKFDDSYLGYAQISITQEYYDDTDNNGGLSVNTLKSYTTPVKTYYVNSDEVVVNLSLKVRLSAGHIQTNYDPCKNFTPSVTVSNANVTKIGLLTSIDQVIDILSDIYTSVDDIEGLSTNQLTELENIVNKIDISNDYLEILTELRQYDVDFESLPVIMAMMSRYGNKLLDIYDNIYFSYPLFNIQANSNIIVSSINANTIYRYIFIVDKVVVNVNSFNQNFDVVLSNGNSANITNYKNISNQFSIVNNNATTRGYICSIDISTNSNANVTIRNKVDMIYSPIYFGTSDNKYLSTDFALKFGLSNSLLDNIQIITNGTSQSNSAASDLESEASEYSDIADDVIGVEEGLTSNFESSVNQIDLNTGLNGFGGNFMTSATWVRTQFDRLTENTPYGSLVVYGLTLGFVLLMLGKVLL